MMRISSSAVTHRGRVRTTNEDSILATDRLVAVADGMGGHAAGEVASRMAVERMSELADRNLVPGDLVPEDVVNAVIDANRLICAEGAANLGHAGMGTTLCGVCLVTVDEVEQCAVFNVGDSRVYRFHDGALAQVSVDHSEVQELRDAGKLSDEAAAAYPRRNVITRCLGSASGPVPDIWIFPPVEHERFLVCSDGLTEELDDATISRLLEANDEPVSAADALLQHALAAGGRDNIAAIVVNVDRDAATP